MRLSDRDRRLLDQSLRRMLGVDCEILVFGSRLDENARGGDLLDGRRVDVLLIDLESTLEPIHRSALQQGQPL